MKDMELLIKKKKRKKREYSKGLQDSALGWPILAHNEKFTWSIRVLD